MGTTEVYRGLESFIYGVYKVLGLGVPSRGPSYSPFVLPLWVFVLEPPAVEARKLEHDCPPTPKPRGDGRQA